MTGDRERCIKSGMDDYISKLEKTVYNHSLAERVAARVKELETLNAENEALRHKIGLAL